MSSLVEKVIFKVDKLLNIFFADHSEVKRPLPVRHECQRRTWDAEELYQSQAQMRINHTGEICAQALYAGHYHRGISSELSTWLHEAADEEYDHLIWCRARLNELNTRPSLLNPVFYMGSFCIARSLSLFDQKLNLAFIKETEAQVQEHLQEQLVLLKHDQRSREIIQQMILDEKKHHDTAESFGGEPVSSLSSKVMRFMASVMKSIVFYI
jgi:ubiquinone biosynthesis monooxygenase Coq7